MRKLLITVIAVVLGASLIYGATMAWFTDTDTVDAAKFTAGTIDIDAATPVIANFNGTQITNVNPGDDFSISLTVNNIGTKDAIIRILPTFNWDFPTGGVPYGSDLYVLGSTFFSYNEDDDVWQGGDANWTVSTSFALNPDCGLVLTYTGTLVGTIPESSGNQPSATITIPLLFKGDLMDNRFQGHTLTIGGTVQAIQAVHGSWANYPTI